jgi:hypothetical protein
VNELDDEQNNGKATKQKKDETSDVGAIGRVKETTRAARRSTILLI